MPKNPACGVDDGPGAGETAGGGRNPGGAVGVGLIYQDWGM